MKFLSVAQVEIILDHQLFRLRMLLSEAEFEKNKNLIKTIESQIEQLEGVIAKLSILALEVA